MNNNKLLSLLNKLQIVFGLGFIVMILVYFYYYPTEMNGTIDKSLFEVVFTNASGTINSFNTLLILTLFLVVVNIVVSVYTFKFTEHVSPVMKDNVLMNTLFSVLLLVSILLFYVLIPTEVNGEVMKGFFRVRFEVLSGEYVHAWFFAYPLAFIYVGYNIYSLVMYSKEVEITE